MSINIKSLIVASNHELRHRGLLLNMLQVTTLYYIEFNFMNGSLARTTKVESDCGVRFTLLFSRSSGDRGYYEVEIDAKNYGKIRER